MRPLAVVAIGGNALTRADQPGRAEEIEANAAEAAAQVAALRRAGRRVVVVHGNGPQVGNLSLQQESGPALVPAQPLHQLCAMTQGQLGSVLVRAIDGRCGQGAAVAVITHAAVDPADPAFDTPTKPVGPFFTAARAAELAAEHGWQVEQDAGRGYRRVVASPMPSELVEIEAIRTLVAAGFVVVAAGGGGIGVSRGADGTYQGVDGVIDKDHAATSLAVALGAEDLYLLTGVDAVRLDFGTPQERPVHQLTEEQARSYLDAGQFPAGSMGPKVAAALAFLAGGGTRAVITSARLLGAAAAGRARTGTTVVSEVPALAGQR
jgi:carbamate kinase